MFQQEDHTRDGQRIFEYHRPRVEGWSRGLGQQNLLLSRGTVRLKIAVSNAQLSLKGATQREKTAHRARALI
jgi:hypothetical protein